jgi:molybdenum cofactor biosynthesis enzyme
MVVIGTRESKGKLLFNGYRISMCKMKKFWRPVSLTLPIHLTLLNVHLKMDESKIYVVTCCTYHNEKRPHIVWIYLYEIPE